MKIYIHHQFDKSLLYTLGNNTTNREYFIENNVGSVLCKYKNTDIEFIFKQEISFEDDGYHILDYFTAYFNSSTDPKIGPILPDRSYMDRENQQILKIFINLLKDCPKNQKWLITYFRTEKIFQKYEEIGFDEKSNEIESLLEQLNQHYIITDNFFLNNHVKSKYENVHFALTNSIFQWNKNLNIRWWYEFKQVYDRLNFEYDLMYSVRNHKSNRVSILNELKNLNNNKIYLQTCDALNHNKYYKKNGSLVSNDIKNNSIVGDTDFDDISYIENLKGCNDIFFRVLTKAKMQILCESWSWSTQTFTSQYLSEKTIGLLLAGIPFISTHEYPIEMVEKIFDVPPHPFYNESKKYKVDGKLFSKFVKEFMENFDENYVLCKEWSDMVHTKFMYRMNNENSLLDLILNNDLKKNNTIKQNII